MPRLDLKAIFTRGRKAPEAYAERDSIIARYAETDGYKATLDLFEREMRDCFRVWLSESDYNKSEQARSKGRAIFDLIRLVDRKTAVVQAAETVEEASKRQVEDLQGDRQELAELDRALMERAMAAPGARRADHSRPAMKPVY